MESTGSALMRIFYRVFSNPLSVFLFASWVLFTIAEYYGHTHPIEYLIRELKYIHSSRGIDLSIFVTLLENIKKYKHAATLISLNIVTFILRPHFLNLFLLVLYSAYVIVHPALDFYFHAAVSVSVFFYLGISGGRNKFIVVITAFAILYIYYAKPAAPPPAKTK